MSLTTARSRAPAWLRDIPPVTLLLVVAGRLYARALDVPWYFDDYSVLVDNPTIRSLSRALEGSLQPRGLAFLSFAAGNAFFGPDAAAAHAVNVGVHLTTTVLVYAVLRTLSPGSRLPAFGGALLFAVHPLQTQAVLYAVQRMASLAALWFVLAILLFLRARRLATVGSAWTPRHLALYVGALLAAAAAFFTKQNTVVFPAAFLAADLLFAPPGLRARARVAYHAPFFALASLLALREVLPVLVAAGPGGGGSSLVRSFDWFLVGYTRPGEAILETTPLRYEVTQLSVLWEYLRLVVAPWGQSFDHGYPLAREYLTVRNIAAALGLAALVAVALRARRRAPFLSLGIVLFLLGLSVESVFPLDVMVEHRVYLSMPGVSLACVEVLRRIRRPGVAAAAIAAGSIALAGLTLHRVELWTRPIALFENDLGARPGNPRLWALLGESRQEHGDLTGAAAAFSSALELHPQYPQAMVDLAGIRATEGRPDEAERLYRRALGLVPGFPAARRALGIVLMRQQRLEEALQEFSTATRMNPKDVRSLYFEARLAHELGDDARAAVATERLGILDPELAADVRAAIGR